jgi:predicted nuclease of restriction endonuclease-like (RecB) superfamily
VTPLSAEAVPCLSWTKLIELIRIEDPLKRAFYENECLGGNWSVRQLQRQIEARMRKGGKISAEGKR